MEEKWKKVTDYNYMVSNTGRIKSLPYKCQGRWGLTRKKGKEIKPVVNKVHGYAQVSLVKDGNKKNFRFHRLVADSFCSNPRGAPCVNHIDGDKTNNKSDNLEWVTHSENTIHAVKNRLLVVQRGEDSSRSKLRESEVRLILQLIKAFPSCEIADRFNVSKSTISDIKNGRTWRHLIDN